MTRPTIGLLLTLALSLLAAPLLGAEAQPRQVPRIGYLAIGTVASHGRLLEAFTQGLRDLGWIEGQSIAIEYRWVAGQMDRLPALAEELVRLPVDCLVTTSTPVSQAAKDATTSIPIVMAVSADPVGTGLVASLARPGGNLMGMSSISPELGASGSSCSKRYCRRSPGWPSCSMGGIPPTGTSSGKRRTRPSASASSCSRW